MALFIGFMSGLFWSFFDITRKLSLKIIKPEILLFLFSISQIVVFSLWMIFDNFFLNIANYFFVGFLLILISIFSAILFLKALNLSEISMSIPLLSFSPIFSAIFANFLLNEKLISQQYIGIFMIVIGTLVLYSEKTKSYNLKESFKKIFLNKGSRYMLIVSLIWSITPVLDKICLNHSSMNAHGLIQSIGMFICLICIYSINMKKIISVYKVQFKLITSTLTIGVVATILQFYAITLLPVPVMESVKRSIGQSFSIFYGKFYFSEQINKQKILGILFICLGVFLVLILL